MSEDWLDEVKWTADGLVPAIAPEALPAPRTVRLGACSVITRIEVPLQTGGRPGRDFLRARMRSRLRTRRPTARRGCDPAS